MFVHFTIVRIIVKLPDAEQTHRPHSVNVNAGLLDWSKMNLEEQNPRLADGVVDLADLKYFLRVGRAHWHRRRIV